MDFKSFGTDSRGRTVHGALTISFFKRTNSNLFNEYDAENIQENIINIELNELISKISQSLVTVRGTRPQAGSLAQPATEVPVPSAAPMNRVTFNQKYGDSSSWLTDDSQPITRTLWSRDQTVWPSGGPGFRGGTAEWEKKLEEHKRVLEESQSHMINPEYQTRVVAGNRDNPQVKIPVQCENCADIFFLECRRFYKMRWADNGQPPNTQRRFKHFCRATLCATKNSIEWKSGKSGPTARSMLRMVTVCCIFFLEFILVSNFIRYGPYHMDHISIIGVSKFVINTFCLPNLSPKSMHKLWYNL